MVADKAGIRRTDIRILDLGNHKARVSQDVRERHVGRYVEIEARRQRGQRVEDLVGDAVGIRRGEKRDDASRLQRVETPGDNSNGCGRC